MVSFLVCVKICRMKGIKGMAVKRTAVQEAFCMGCQRTHPVTEFYKSNAPYHPNGVLPYCKDATEKILQHYLKKSKSLESAIWLTCATVGIPFIHRAYEVFEKKNEGYTQGANRKYFGLYLNAMTTVETKQNPFIDFYDTDTPLDGVASIKRSKEALKFEYEKFELDWGKQEVEDYQYLEYRYDTYTGDLEEMSPAQETLYRKLCLVELAMRKKEELHEDTKSEQQQMLSLMDKLKISLFTNKDEEGVEVRMIEARIAWMEQEEPAEHFKDKEKYCDFMSIKSYFYNHIFRPLKNLLIGSKEYTLQEVNDEIAPTDKEE